jgi:TonB-linked SusC/RagA family outer membrane protein
MKKIERLRQLAICVMALLLCLPVCAQQTPLKVQGFVRNEKGDALAGATVSEKGTSKSTQTQPDGSFTLTVSSGNAILVATYVGYQSKEMPVNGQSTVNFAISQGKSSLDDVVVIGYGTKTRATVTSSIVSVSAEEIRSRPVANALQAIQGKAAGVDVTSNERPGESSGILIRGVRSITAGNGPLFVVDGVPLNFGGIEAINPNDIESIDILKDASATAVYGSRGANGVVLVTTKRGKSGALNTSYVGTVTLETLQDRNRMMNSGEYIEYRRDAWRRVRYLNPAAAANTTYPDQPTFADDQRIFANDNYALANIAKGWANGVWQPELVPTTDWGSYGKQTALSHDHVISVSGGSQNVRAYGSFGYLYNEGTVIGQDFKRYTGKFSVDLTPSKWFSMGGSVNTTYGLQNYGFNSTTSSTGPSTLYFALRGMLPYAQPYDSFGKRIYLPGGDINIVNPIDENQYNVNLRKTLRIIGSIYAEAKLFKGLRYRVNFGPDYRNYYNGRWQDANSINRGGGVGATPNFAELSQGNNISWNLDNLVYYDKTFRGNHVHDLGITLLQSALYRRDEGGVMSAINLPLPNQKWYGLSSVPSLNSYNTTLSENSLTSYMVRANYTLDQKYMLSAFVRWDGASQLAAGKKWDVFPSVSLGWRLEKEKFLQNVKWITQLKLRAGYAAVGNAAVDPYRTLGGLQGLYYTWGSNVSLGYVNSDPTAANPATYPDQNMGWERTTQTNVGVDFTFFNGRLSGTIDLYRTRTSDLLLEKVINPVTGYTRILTNIGATSGRGIDFNITSVNLRKRNFNWTTTLNLSHSKEKIEELSNGKLDDIGNLWFIGQRVSVFYDYQYAGIWQNTPADLELMAKFNTNGHNFKPGDIKVVDQNGDNRINANSDRVLRGHSQPNLVAGMTNDFTYKGFGLSVFIYSRLGGTYATGAENLDGRFAQRYVDYWTPTNTSALYPAPNKNSASGDPFKSAMNYQSASFVKIRNITLSYTLTAEQSRKLRMQNLKVYVQALNPGLIYSGIQWIDPDLGGSTFNRGFVLGINANF